MTAMIRGPRLHRGLTLLKTELSSGSDPFEDRTSVSWFALGATSGTIRFEEPASFGFNLARDGGNPQMLEGDGRGDRAVHTGRNRAVRAMVADKQPAAVGVARARDVCGWSQRDGGHVPRRRILARADERTLPTHADADQRRAGFQKGGDPTVGRLGPSIAVHSSALGETISTDPIRSST